MQQEARHRWASSATKTLPTTTTTIVETLESFPYQNLHNNNNNNNFSSSFFLPLTIMSNGRDRTGEFQTTVRTFASRRNGLDGPLQAPTNRRQHPQSAMEQRGIFMQQAKKIGYDLSQTFLKLEQLSMIAKQSSLFNDKSMEIQDLTLSVKQDISNLNRQIAQLQQYMIDAHGSKSKNSQTHSNSVVFVLQSKLATMSNDFKQVLEARTQNLKEQKTRRDNFSRNTVASSLTATPPIVNGRPSVLFRDEQRTTNGGDAVIDMGSYGMHNSSMKQQLQVIDETDTYLANRSEAMQNIEQTIIELGDIFTQLATMVRQQEELVHRIDANVDEATHHIEGAHTELLKYLRSVTSNRWLIIKVFAVLIIFFLIFIVFLA
jgi:syntaxin 5